MDKSGGNPFFKTVNNGYGEHWQSSGGVNPLQMQETPEYRDLVIIHISLPISYNLSQSTTTFVLKLLFYRVSEK
jgi:hypothetical protein